MIAWGYELFRSMRQFLGCQSLNLGLMDEFQAFTLSLLIEGNKSFCLVLEHVTGMWASGELDRSRLPVYHWIVLLQPHVA